MNFRQLHITGLLLALSSIPPAYADRDPQRVMVVHSSEQNHICGAPQGDNLEVQSYYMDTKKTHTSPAAIRDQARRALAQIEHFKPTVVVVLDDNAIREVMLPLVGRKDIAVVFSGMNGQPRDYNRKRLFMDSTRRPGGNVTGVYEKLHLEKSLVVVQAALAGFRDGDRVIGITDFTPTGNAITRQFELELANSELKQFWELRRVKNLEEYQDLIAELNQDHRVRAIYPAALSLQSSTGETWTAPRIFAWTRSNNHKPEMALNYYFAKIGLFGGAAVDFTAMGNMAGKKVAAILAGSSPGDLPIEDAKDYAIVFNVARAESLGVDIPKSLLTAADHIYRDPLPQ